MFFRFFLFVIFLGGAVQAQERTPSHCQAVAQSAPGIDYMVPAWLSPQDGATVHVLRTDVLGSDSFQHV